MIKISEIPIDLTFDRYKKRYHVSGIDNRSTTDKSINLQYHKNQKSNINNRKPKFEKSKSTIMNQILKKGINLDLTVE